jgi:hypothetical protein
MDTIITLLIVIGILFAFDCGVIIYLAHVMKDMKKSDENKDKENE